MALRLFFSVIVAATGTMVGRHSTSQCDTCLLSAKHDISPIFRKKIILYSIPRCHQTISGIVSVLSKYVQDCVSSLKQCNHMYEGQE